MRKSLIKEFYFNLDEFSKKLVENYIDTDYKYLIPGISLLIRVKNEINNIKLCIESAINIPDEIIDGYVHGVAARHKQHAQIASEIVGGSEELTGIIQWAQENLDDNERQAVNSGLSNIGWQNVLLGLNARRTQANAHSEPKTKVQTSSGISNGIKPFASPAEMTAAMRDPRYKNDPDFQENVYARLRITGHSKNDV